jgi:hypothetical protein
MLAETKLSPLPTGQKRSLSEGLDTLVLLGLRAIFTKIIRTLVRVVNLRTIQPGTNNWICWVLLIFRTFNGHKIGNQGDHCAYELRKN